MIMDDYVVIMDDYGGLWWIMGITGDYVDYG